MSRHSTSTSVLVGTCVFAGVAAMVQLINGADVSADSPSHFRIAVSARMMGDDVNENDARIAMKVWADAIARQSGMAIEYPQSIVSPTGELTRMIRQKSLDGFGLLTEEFLDVASMVDHKTIMVDDRYAEGGEEYLLLVHQDSGLKKIEELRGKSLMVEKNTRAALALPWLELALAGAKMRPVNEHFSRISANSKPSRVVLPVFFRQADACLVTRSGFEVM
jgi:hypothetical protein